MRIAKDEIVMFIGSAMVIVGFLMILLIIEYPTTCDWSDPNSIRCHTELVFPYMLHGLLLVAGGFVTVILAFFLPLETTKKDLICPWCGEPIIVSSSNQQRLREIEMATTKEYPEHRK